MKKTLLILILLTGICFSAKSTHIVGGDTHFEQTGPNTYLVKMRLFWDCGNGPNGYRYPLSLPLAILDNVTDLPVAGSPFSVINDSMVPLILGDECYTPTGLCVEAWYYSATITLPNNPNGYYCTWSTGGRTIGILNIAGGNNLWYAQIPDPAITGGNYSPKFVDYPPDGYFCVGYDKDIDFSCTDSDPNDSLVYSLIQPYSNPGAGGARPFTLAAYNATYNLTNILGPGSSCIINSSTGIVTARPARIGTFIIAVKCEEYRNGVKIGEVIRDVQIFGLNCAFDSPPRFDISEDPIQLKFDRDTCFDILAVDQDVSDTFLISVVSNAFAVGAYTQISSDSSYTWKDVSGSITTSTSVAVDDLGGNLFRGIGEVGVQFCWNTTDCDILSVDSFYVDYYGYSIGCSGNSDSIIKRIPLSVLSGDYDYNVPNVFSPNGDGVNDIFYLKKDAYDRCYDALNIRVYNRWGQLVYESQDAKFEWDGNDVNGNPLSAGSYFVILQGYYGGEEVTQNFPLTLFR